MICKAYICEEIILGYKNEWLNDRMIKSDILDIDLFIVTIKNGWTVPRHRQSNKTYC